MRKVTIDQLFEVVARVYDCHPEAELIKNQVGNLAILVGGKYVGYLDMSYPEDSEWEIDNGSQR